MCSVCGEVPSAVSFQRLVLLWGCWHPLPRYPLPPNQTACRKNWTLTERRREPRGWLKNQQSTNSMSLYLCVCVRIDIWRHVNINLLGDREGLVVELLDELCSHLVWVVGRGVGTLLLQEVNFNCHGTDALLGLVKVVVGHWGDRQGWIDLLQ